MERFLEKFAHFLATNVILVYLAGMFLGTLVYFTQAAFGVSPSLELTVGVCLAFAVEVHSFLEQRQTRHLFQLWSHLDPESEQRKIAGTQVLIHLALTAGLVLFSMFNAIAYWAIVMHPQTWQDWAQVVVRGMVIPLFFMAAGFLTPLHHDASDTLDHAAASILSKTVKVTIRQWHRRVKQNAKNGVDLSPVVIELLNVQGDKGAAERVSLIATQLEYAERRHTRVGESLPAPTERASNRIATPVVGSADTPLRFTGPILEPPADTSEPEPAYESLTPEQKCRIHYVAGMTAGALRRASGVSKTSANKYWRVLAAEHGITLPPAGHQSVKKPVRKPSKKTVTPASEATV